MMYLRWVNADPGGQKQEWHTALYLAFDSAKITTFLSPFMCVL